MNPVAQTSANATFQGGASAPMDIGALAAALWKGKGKRKGKGKGKGKEAKGKEKGKGKGVKGKGKGKGLFEVVRKRKSTLELYEKKRKANF